MKLINHHPAFDESRTIFGKTVKPIHSMADYHSRDTGILKTGIYNKKLGGLVTKGQFKGYSLYSLTFEERATCPRSCFHWKTCYGNNMAFAHRFAINPETIEEVLVTEIKKLFKKNLGLLIRLHVLGDFYSVEYVEVWERILKRFKNVACYGYTARNPLTDIGLQVLRLRGEFGNRFAIRNSGLIDSDYSSLSSDLNDTGKDFGRDHFTCLEQLGKKDSCATCTACWESKKKKVYFKTH